MQRLFKPLLFGYLHGHDAEWRNLASRVFDGNIMLDPMAWFRPVVEHETDFEIQDGLPGSQHAIELRLNHLGKVAQHFSDGLSQMLRGRYAVHFRHRPINREIVEAAIQDAKADP